MAARTRHEEVTVLVRPSAAPPPDDLPAAVEAAAEALVLVFGRAAEGLHPRVSASQLRALLVVERHHEVNLHRLAGALGAIPSSTSRLCDRLQAAGLLDRSISRSDRRAVVLSLTGDGRRLLAAMRAERRADLARVLGAMTDQARAELLAGLHEFSAAVTRSE
jgi:DNA-binding MarR family transcriptional regulator